MKRAPASYVIVAIALIATGALVACERSEPTTLNVGRHLPAVPAFSFEPSGYTEITDRPWNAFNESGWSDDTTSTRYTLVVDPTAPKSPISVGQMDFPLGWQGGYEPAYAVRSIGPLGYTRLYLSFWVNLSSTFEGNAICPNKVYYIWMHGAAVLAVSLYGVDLNPLYSRMQLTSNTPNPGDLAPNRSNGEFARG